MGFNKGHKEFHTIAMDSGWETLPGYPAGIKQKIIAGELDERGKRGNRTRLLKFEHNQTLRARLLGGGFPAIRRPDRGQ
jgi:hypothetical protein